MAMKVVEVNVGEKIPYTVSKTKVTFDDELMLNLAKLERDFDVSVDICIDKFAECKQYLHCEVHTGS